MKKQVTFSARQFAQAMGVSYRTVMYWLAAEIIPGVEKRMTPIEHWVIPERALKMARPKMGPKPGKGRGKK